LEWGCPLGSQYSLPCQWLKAADIPHNVKVRELWPAPAPQMFSAAENGVTWMGYCNRRAVGIRWRCRRGVGVCVLRRARNLTAAASSRKGADREKGVAEKHGEEHEALIGGRCSKRALSATSRKNRNQLCDLAGAAAIREMPPIECSKPSFARNAAELGNSSMHSLHGFEIFFHRYRANDPTASKQPGITGRLYEFLKMGRASRPLWTTFFSAIFSCEAKAPDKRQKKFLKKRRKRREGG